MSTDAALSTNVCLTLEGWDLVPHGVDTSVDVGQVTGSQVDALGAAAIGCKSAIPGTRKQDDDVSQLSLV